MSNKPRKFVVIPSPTKGRSTEIADEIKAWLISQGCEIFELEDKDINCVDLAIVIGGDGMMMDAVTKMSTFGVPCIGLNTGQVGFHMVDEAINWRNVLPRILCGEYIIQDRLGLELEYTKNGEFNSWGPFVNDIVLKHPTSIVRFRVESNGDIRYRDLPADGVLLFTSTGSSAYNLSANGSIFDPELDAIGITPLYPTRVNTRPIIMPPSKDIRVTILDSKNGEKVKIIGDGREIENIGVGESIIVRKHSIRILFALFDSNWFYQKLQDVSGLAK